MIALTTPLSTVHSPRSSTYQLCPPSRRAKRSDTARIKSHLIADIPLQAHGCAPHASLHGLDCELRPRADCNRTRRASLTPTVRASRAACCARLLHDATRSPPTPRTNSSSADCTVPYHPKFLHVTLPDLESLWLTSRHPLSAYAAKFLLTAHTHHVTHASFTTSLQRQRHKHSIIRS